jgi:hypothetical protein
MMPSPSHYTQAANDTLMHLQIKNIQSCSRPNHIELPDIASAAGEGAESATVRVLLLLRLLLLLLLRLLLRLRSITRQITLDFVLF